MPGRLQRDLCDDPGSPKISWEGAVLAIQPRIRLSRAFDQRDHTFQGFVLKPWGRIGEERPEFLVLAPMVR